MLPSPLMDSTNSLKAVSAWEAPPPPSPASLPLHLLADASLARLVDAKRQRGLHGQPVPPLECSESAFEAFGPVPPSLETTTNRPRPASRRSPADDASSSRSISPSTGMRGAFSCLRCGREYASTDAVRKHARQNHADWLREQGGGCPSLYCAPVDPAIPATALTDGATFSAARPEAVARMVARPVVATPPPSHLPALAQTCVPCATDRPAVVAAMVAATPAQQVVKSTVTAALVDSSRATTTATAVSRTAAVPLSPGSLGAAEWLVGFHAPSRQSSDGADTVDAFVHGHRAPLDFEGRWPVAAFAAPKVKAAGGYKRPRSVRCGQCPGCIADDCGTCKNCVDKPKFGGIGQRKQGCIRKLCRQPRVAA